MRRFTAVSAAAILVAVGLVVFSSIGGIAAEGRTLRVRWEYKVVPASDNLNELGIEGWELVATSTSATSSVHAYFKRPTSQQF